MERNEFGVWTIKIPDTDLKPSIPHNSRVKFRFKHGNGIWVDRIPAWIRYTTVDPNHFAAPYDGVHWDPPPSERSEVLFFFFIILHLRNDFFVSYCIFTAMTCLKAKF